MPGISHYLRLVKFSHTIFALPFAAIGFLAGLKAIDFLFDPLLILLVLLCMIFARSAAMAFNRYTDRHIDALNFRTQQREIPSGVISERSALVFTVINSLAFIIVTYCINPLCFYLSPVALLVVLGYSYTKRFTSLSHLILGLGLALAPIGAYLAVTGAFALFPILFSLAVISWVSGFDIIYSLQDEEFDRQQKLFSIPALFGGKRALMVSSLLHLLTSIFLLWAYTEGNLGWVYLAGWVVFSLLLVYQHTLVKPGDLSRVNAAFFTTNGIASVVLALFFTFDLFL